MELKIERAMLVYQSGIANVFAVDCFNVRASGRSITRRLFQGSFSGAVMFCHGLGCAGTIVRSAHCNRAGDIAGVDWREDVENAVFSPQNIRINDGEESAD